MTAGRFAQQVIWSVRESLCKYTLEELFRRYLFAGRVAPYVELPSLKAFGELLGESLLVEWIESVAGQVVAGRCAPYVEPPSEVTKLWASL
jgi:hypothetical protein